MRKKVASLLVATMILGLCACGADSTNQGLTESGSGKDKEVISSADQSDKEQEIAEPAEPLKFTYMTFDRSEVWSPDDLPMVELQERTNTEIEFITYPVDAYDTSLQTALTADKLPDVIQTITDANIAMLIDQGAVLPIEDLLEEYGQNIINVIGRKNIEAGKAVDGHLYQIPALYITPLTQGWMIRKDWLENCGKEVPNTWDEWVDVMKAFRDMDANGNGDLNDEIPFAGLYEKFMFSFGIYSNDIFCVDDEGKYGVIYDHANYRDYLEALVELYDEGLLSKDYLDYSNSEQVLKTAMASDLVGISYTFMNNMHMADEIEGGEYIYMAPVLEDDGNRSFPGRISTGFLASNSALISVDAEDKAVELIKFFDYIFSEEGQILFSYGVEGVHYDVVDGKPVIRPEFASDFNTYRSQGMNYQTIPHVWLMDSYVQVFNKGLHGDDLDSVGKQFAIGTEENEKYAVGTPPVIQTDAYKEYYSVIVPEIKALEAKAVTGQISVDAFFEQYAAKRDSGIKQMVEEGDAIFQTMEK